MTDFKRLYTSLHSLTVFRSLLNDAVIEAFGDYLSLRADGGISSSIDRYCEFVSRLFSAHSCNLTRYISELVYNDENVYILSAASHKPVPKQICEAVRAELSVLQEIAELSPAALQEGLEWSGFLPNYEVESINIAEVYTHRAENIEKYGYGIYARYHMFYLGSESRIIPVKNPDTIRLSDLVDYKREQKIIIDNTRALLAGKPAANILLTGDAGTGKSSTVKAVVNELYGEGLRILEVRKEQLHSLPAILDALAVNPLKFIIFIDDLSFQSDDDNFGALKAILEGSVSARSENVVIYATGNRRHLIKEKFSDRDGDDIHRNDTMQELLSLSERFGIQITFERPDKQTYLDIVHSLALQSGITPDDRLDADAERFVLGRGNRSARAARQFIDGILAKQ